MTNGYDSYTTVVITECEDCEIEIEKEVEAEGGWCEIQCPKCKQTWNKEVG